jgi:hypothetical protein
MIMKISLIILLSSYCLLALACGDKVQLIGKWKREINPNLEDQYLVANTGWGDINFSSDSTFSMQGDTTVEQISDTTPGWHVSGPLKGTWRIEKNHLLLYFEDIVPQFPLRYKIVQLTDKRLMLLSALDKGDTTMKLTYSRRK